MDAIGDDALNQILLSCAVLKLKHINKWITSIRESDREGNTRGKSENQQMTFVII